LPAANVGVRVIVVRPALFLTQEERVEVGELWKRPAGCLGEERPDGLGDGQVLLAPQGQEGQVAEVVVRRHPRCGQPVPDGRHVGLPRRVVDPVGPRGMGVEAVRVGRAQDRGEPAVEHSGLTDELAVERQIALQVVAECVVVVGALAEAVELAPRVLDPAAGVGVVRVVEAAALVLGQVMGGVPDAVVVGIAQTGLPAVRAREPAQVVVEGPVLHAQEHDVLDPAGRGRW